MPTQILHKEKLIPGRTSKLVLDAPQIAATADTHFFVSKREIDGRTESAIRPLEYGERVAEIARIIGGARVTAQAEAAARELLESGK